MILFVENDGLALYVCMSFKKTMRVLAIIEEKEKEREKEKSASEKKKMFI
jgi:hypothetical protein